MDYKKYTGQCLGEIQQWLEDTLSIHIPHVQQGPLKSLRNGIHLASVAVKHVHGAGKHVHDKKGKKYYRYGLSEKHRENLLVFVRALQILGVPEEHIPEVDKVWRGENMVMFMFSIRLFALHLSQAGKCGELERPLKEEALDFDEEEKNGIAKFVTKNMEEIQRRHVMYEDVKKECIEKSHSVGLELIRLTEAIDCAESNHENVFKMMSSLSSKLHLEEEYTDLYIAKMLAERGERDVRTFTLLEIQNTVYFVNLQKQLEKLNGVLKSNSASKTLKELSNDTLHLKNIKDKYKSQYHQRLLQLKYPDHHQLASLAVPGASSTAGVVDDKGTFLSVRVVQKAVDDVNAVKYIAEINKVVYNDIPSKTLVALKNPKAGIHHIVDENSCYYQMELESAQRNPSVLSEMESLHDDRSSMTSLKSTLSIAKTKLVDLMKLPKKVMARKKSPSLSVHIPEKTMDESGTLKEGPQSAESKDMFGLQKLSRKLSGEGLNAKDGEKAMMEYEKEALLLQRRLSIDVANVDPGDGESEGASRSSSVRNLRDLSRDEIQKIIVYCNRAKATLLWLTDHTETIIKLQRRVRKILEERGKSLQRGKSEDISKETYERAKMYLSSIAELKTWMAACIKNKDILSSKQGVLEFEQQLCAGVYLFHLGKFLAPGLFKGQKVFDGNHEKFNQKGLLLEGHFKNLQLFTNVQNKFHFPKEKQPKVIGWAESTPAFARSLLDFGKHLKTKNILKSPTVDQKSAPTQGEIISVCRRMGKDPTPWANFFDNKEDLTNNLIRLLSQKKKKKNQSHKPLLDLLRNICDHVQEEYTTGYVECLCKALLLKDNLPPGEVISLAREELDHFHFTIFQLALNRSLDSDNCMATYSCLCWKGVKFANVNMQHAQYYHNRLKALKGAGPTIENHEQLQDLMSLFNEQGVEIRPPKSQRFTAPSLSTNFTSLEAQKGTHATEPERLPIGFLNPVLFPILHPVKSIRRLSNPTRVERAFPAPEEDMVEVEEDVRFYEFTTTKVQEALDTTNEVRDTVNRFMADVGKVVKVQKLVCAFVRRKQNEKAAQIGRENPLSVLAIQRWFRMVHAKGELLQLRREKMLADVMLANQKMQDLKFRTGFESIVYKERNYILGVEEVNMYMSHVSFARAWIAQVTKETMPDILHFEEELKTGVILCKLGLALCPGAFSKSHVYITEEKMPLCERHFENFSLWFKVLQKLTIPHSFYPSLYELYTCSVVPQLIFNVYAVYSVLQSRGHIPMLTTTSMNSTGDEARFLKFQSRLHEYTFPLPDFGRIERTIQAKKDPLGNLVDAINGGRDVEVIKGILEDSIFDIPKLNSNNFEDYIHSATVMKEARKNVNFFRPHEVVHIDDISAIDVLREVDRINFHRGVDAVNDYLKQDNVDLTLASMQEICLKLKDIEPQYAERYFHELKLLKAHGFGTYNIYGKLERGDIDTQDKILMQEEDFGTRAYLSRPLLSGRPRSFSTGHYTTSSTHTGRKSISNPIKRKRSLTESTSNYPLEQQQHQTYEALAGILGASLPYLVIGLNSQVSREISDKVHQSITDESLGYNTVERRISQYDMQMAIYLVNSQYRHWNHFEENVDLVKRVQRAVRSKLKKKDANLEEIEEEEEEKLAEKGKKVKKGNLRDSRPDDKHIRQVREMRRKKREQLENSDHVDLALFHVWEMLEQKKNEKEEFLTVRQRSEMLKANNLKNHLSTAPEASSSKVVKDRVEGIEQSEMRAQQETNQALKLEENRRLVLELKDAMEDDSFAKIEKGLAEKAGKKPEEEKMVEDTKADKKATKKAEKKPQDESMAQDAKAEKKAGKEVESKSEDEKMLEVPAVDKKTEKKAEDKKALEASPVDKKAGKKAKKKTEDEKMAEASAVDKKAGKKDEKQSEDENMVEAPAVDKKTEKKAAKTAEDEKMIEAPAVDKKSEKKTEDEKMAEAPVVDKKAGKKAVKKSEDEKMAEASPIDKKTGKKAEKKAEDEKMVGAPAVDKKAGKKAVKKSEDEIMAEASPIDKKTGKKAEKKAEDEKMVEALAVDKASEKTAEDEMREPPAVDKKAGKKAVKKSEDEKMAEASPIDKKTGKKAEKKAEDEKMVEALAVDKASEKKAEDEKMVGAPAVDKKAGKKAVKKSEDEKMAEASPIDKKTGKKAEKKAEDEKMVEALAVDKVSEKKAEDEKMVGAPAVDKKAGKKAVKKSEDEKMAEASPIDKKTGKKAEKKAEDEKMVEALAVDKASEKTAEDEMREPPAVDKKPEKNAEDEKKVEAPVAGKKAGEEAEKKSEEKDTKMDQNAGKKSERKTGDEKEPKSEEEEEASDKKTEPKAKEKEEAFDKKTEPKAKEKEETFDKKTQQKAKEASHKKIESKAKEKEEAPDKKTEPKKAKEKEKVSAPNEKNEEPKMAERKVEKKAQSQDGTMTDASDKRAEDKQKKKMAENQTEQKAGHQNERKRPESSNTPFITNTVGQDLSNQPLSPLSSTKKRTHLARADAESDYDRPIEPENIPNTDANTLDEALGAFSKKVIEPQSQKKESAAPFSCCLCKGPVPQSNSIHMGCYETMVSEDKADDALKNWVIYPAFAGIAMLKIAMLFAQIAT
eukprot:Nk52_evm8s2578 gene=Nk52_evmTU8s2578